MSKICVIGDMHFRYELPLSSAFSDARRSEWEDVKAKILEEAKKCDAVVFLGDVFHARHNHSSVIREFIEFLKDFGSKEIHILAGNHERYSTFTALDFIDRIALPNWHVYTEPTLCQVAGSQAMMIPFMTPSLLGVEKAEDGVQRLIDVFPKEQTPLAFVHHAIMGSKIYGGQDIDFSVDFFNEIVLPIHSLKERFKLIFGGHLHEKQFLTPNIIVAGSIFPFEAGETEKSIWIINNGEVEEIPLPIRGIYKVDWNDDLDKIFGGIPTKSIVKCYVRTKGTDLALVRETLKRFDASLIIEQYPDERTKVHFDEGVLDLSIEGLLTLYSKAKNLPYGQLLEGFNLIK